MDYGNGSVATAVQCVRLSPDLERMEHLVEQHRVENATALVQLPAEIEPVGA